MKNSSTLSHQPSKKRLLLWIALAFFGIMGIGTYTFYPPTPQREISKVALPKTIQKNTTTHDKKAEQPTQSTPKTGNNLIAKTDEQTQIPILSAGTDHEAVEITENARRNARYKQFIESHPYSAAPKFTREEIKAMPKADRPDLAARLEFLKTVDPNTLTVPRERLSVAREFTAEKLRKKDKAAINGVVWSERGPNNVGGRTRALMFDPNDAAKKKVWAGGVTGGLWYNTDITTTTSWIKVNDFWANIAVSCIAFAPSTPQTFYVGTGESMQAFSTSTNPSSFVIGDGIWKTTDAGVTWTQLASTKATSVDGTKFTYISQMVVNNAGHIFVATRGRSETSGGIIKSTDGGTSWTRVLAPSSGIGTATTGSINSMADIELATNGDLYAGTFNARVFRSSDGGTTWSNITPSGVVGQRVELALAPSTSNVTASTTIYAIGANGSNVGWFRRSDDGGANWTSLTAPKYREQNCTMGSSDFTRGQAWYDLILKVRPDNPNVVLIGGIDVHSTSDGGASWNSISYWTGNCVSYVHADIHNIIFRPTDFDQVIVGCDGGVFHSGDAGTGNSSASFSERNTNYNITQFYACATPNTSGSNRYFAGAQDNGTRRLDGAGITSGALATGGDGAFCFVDQTNPNIVITSYVYNVYYRSTNGGTSFGSPIVNDQNSGEFINPADYDDVANVLYSAGNSGDIKRITNMEATPSSQTTLAGLISGQATAFRANAYMANRLFVGTSGGSLYRIDDAAGDTPVSTSLSSVTGYVTCIDIGATDNELIVTVGNFGAKSVYYSNDGGTSWISKDEVAHGLPDMPVRWALFNPNNTKEVMIATELGVWSTSDITVSNPGWEPTNSGLANVRCDMFQYRAADKQVVLATHGRGIFTTTAFSAPIVATANYTVSPAIGYENQNFTFTDVSTLGTSYSWNFGVGASTATATTKGPHVITYPNSYGWKSTSLSINTAASTSSKTSPAVLPYNTLNYLPANGGDFETNPNHFLASTTTGFRFERGSSAVTGKDGTASGSNAWVTGLTGNYPNDATAMLYTPSFNFTPTGNYTFEFKAKYNVEGSYDGFIVEYSTNQGTSWIQLGNAVAANWYNGTKSSVSSTKGFAANTPFFTGSTAGSFNTFIGNVNFLAGNAQVAFRFVFKSDEADNMAGIAIDDFKITSPVSIATLLPLHNATGISPTANLEATFNRNVLKGTGNILIKRVSDNSVFETIDVATALVSISSATVTINPNTNMAEQASYYVEIPATAFKDVDNVFFGGMTGNNTWKFTTADLTAPSLTTLSPAHNTTSISVTANLIMTFNENVKKGTAGSITIKKLTDNSVVEAIPVTNANVVVTNNSVSVNPAAILDGTTDYYVEVTAGAIQDIAGNNFAGIATGNWKFKTDVENVPPTVVTFSPAHNSIDFPGANNMTITFNENVKKGTAGSIAIYRVVGDAGVENIQITDANVTIAGAVVTINPANDLPGFVELYVEISNGAIQDIAGNNFAGFAGKTTWKFKTDISTPNEDNIVAKSLTVYPNPVAKQVTLQIAQGISFKEVGLRVIDMKGTIVWEKQMPQLTERQDFDWSMLPAGKYLLEVKTKQGSTTKQIIKQ